MRLHLSFEAPWEVKEAPGEQRAAILPGAAGAPPTAVVTYGPLVLRPDEPKRWVEQVVHRDVPAGCAVEVGRVLERTTADGWPMRLVEVKLAKPTGETVEVRLCAMYTFMEHAADVIVRAADPSSMERLGPAVLAVLERGRPDWRGDPACLADVWDLQAPAPRTPRPVPRVEPAADDEVLQRALASLDGATTAADHVRRGILLRQLRRSADALAAFDAALAIDPKLERAHELRGVVLGELGDHAGALAAFERVVALDPADVLVQREVIQSLYALGRFDEGEAARVAFREAWHGSRDPRVQLVTEYVFDRFDGDGFSVHAIETLRPPNPAIYPLLTFAAIERRGDHDHALPATVLVETSDQARSAGTPFVLAATSGAQYRVVGAAKTLPPYADLKRDVLRILTDALRASR